MLEHGKSRGTILALQAAVLVGGLLLWHVLTATRLLDPFFFANPLAVLQRTWSDIASGAIWRHLAVTLTETMLAFGIGTAGGMLFGFWFARAPLVSAVSDPFLK